MGKIPTLTKLETIMICGLIAEGIFGALSGSLVLSECHPYLALTCMALAMASSKVTRFLEKKEAQAQQNIQIEEKSEDK